MSLTSETVKAGFWQTLSVVSRGGIELGVVAVLSRLVTPEEFGLVASASVFFAFFGIFSEVGLGAAVIQKKNITDSFVNTAFFLTSILGIVLTAVSWLFAKPISDFFRNDDLIGIVQVLSIVIFIGNIGVVPRSILAKELDFRRIMVLDFFSYALGHGAISITLAVMGFGAWSIVFARIGQTTLSTAILLIMKPQRIVFRHNISDFKNIVSFGGGLTLSRIFNTLSEQGDYIVIGRLLGSASLGIYERAFKLMQIPGSYFGNVLDQVLFPAMSRIQGEQDRLKMAFNRALGLVFGIMLPVTTFMIVVGPEIVDFVFGSNWKSAILPFQILVITLTFRTTVRIYDSLIRAVGAVYRSALRKFLYSVEIITFSLVGSIWGLAGVAAGVSVAVLINFVTMTFLIKSVLKYDFASIFRPMLANSFYGTIVLVSNGLITPILRRASFSAIITIASVLLVDLLLGVALLKIFKGFGCDAFLTLIEVFRIRSHSKKKE